MKNHRIISICVLLVLAILNFFPLASPAQAGKYNLTGTLLKIELPKSAKVAESMLVDVQLVTYGGQPVPNQTIHFYLNGIKVRSSKTNFAGRTSMVLRQDQMGTYLLRVVYTGSHKHFLAPSNIGTTIQIKPTVVEVQTLPALPNIKFSLNGQIFTSDTNGIASIEVAKVGTYHLEVLPMTFTGPGFQATFSRWGDETFLPFRDVTVPNKQILQAGFDVSHMVSHNFTNLQGQAVDPSLITSLTLRGSNGTVINLNDNQPHWLQANRVVRLGVFQETKILYSVAAVQMKGSNVVSNAQQRFFVHPNDNWTINLLLYSANFSTRDILFNFPVRSQISLEFPNGQIQSLSFGKDEIFTAGGLPRGNYRATAFGPWGIAPSTPIALSRDQDVSLQVISYLDMIIVFVLGLSLVLGLLFIGRPQILSNLRSLPSRLSPATSGNWKETFQVWRINLHSFAKSSSYFEVTPENYKEGFSGTNETLTQEIDLVSKNDIGTEEGQKTDEISAQTRTGLTALCPVCGSDNIVKMGRGRAGRQRIHCNNCGANRTLILEQDDPDNNGDNESPQ
jgi:predicted RNA-binding Zn-ribbon protein involved in translation (DUF1610 family)